MLTHIPGKEVFVRISIGQVYLLKTEKRAVGIQLAEIGGG